MCLVVVVVVVMLVERRRKEYCLYVASWLEKVNHSTFPTAVVRLPETAAVDSWRLC